MNRFPRIGFLLAALGGFLLFTNIQPLHAQTKPGRVSLGLRSTVSLFNHNEASPGTGVGGQFRIQLLKRLNTEWFADYLTSKVSVGTSRRDYHIGWSVMYYLTDPMDFQKRITPYALAGHCFDYTQIRIHTEENKLIEASAPSFRWTSAIQAGLGTHLNISPRFDCSLSAQYMMHFGKHLHVEELTDRVRIYREDHGGLEGHLLITLSASYKFGRRS